MLSMPRPWNILTENIFKIISHSNFRCSNYPVAPNLRADTAAYTYSCSNRTNIPLMGNIFTSQCSIFIPLRFFSRKLWPAWAGKTELLNSEEVELPINYFFFYVGCLYSAPRHLYSSHNLVTFLVSASHSIWKHPCKYVLPWTVQNFGWIKSFFLFFLETKACIKKFHAMANSSKW